MPDERQTPAERPPKKRMSRGTRVLVIIVCVLLAIALLLVGTVLILSAIGRNALTDDDGMNISRDDVESLGSGTVRYNDRLYRYNTDIVTILLMGVDEQVKQDASGIYGNANQSDANILAVLDLRNKEMMLISISRDAMCTLDILDSAGELLVRKILPQADVIAQGVVKKHSLLRDIADTPIEGGAVDIPHLLPVEADVPGVAGVILEQ